MSSTLLIGVTQLLTVAATCQVNALVFYPQDPERQTITGTSIFDWTNEAEAMIEVSTDHCRRVGDANGPTFALGVYHWITDETLSSVEAYSMGVRKSLASGVDTDAVFQSVVWATDINLAEWPHARTVQQ